MRGTSFKREINYIFLELTEISNCISQNPFVILSSKDKKIEMNLLWDQREMTFINNADF